MNKLPVNDGAVGSIGGCVRFKGNKGETLSGYVEKMSYNIVDEMLTMRIWERYLGEYTTFDTGTGIYKIFINEIGYEQKDLLDIGWFQMDLNFVKIYDEKYMSIILPTDFRKIKVNNVLYDNIYSFVTAVNSI